jgi:hypothetical protein
MRLVALGLALLSLSPVSARTLRAAPRKADDDMFGRHVTHLRPADRIVITAMGDAKPDAPTQSRPASLELKGEKAGELWRLWRGLRSGNGKGCFAPGYLLDFYAGAERLLSAQVCFHCCNVTMPDNSIRGICGDGKAFGRLHAFVTRAVPPPEPQN